MVVFPNCKINLGLHILRKRDDGYHDLETIFYPISFTDALEVVTASSTDQSSLTVTGIPVQGNAGDNLCTRAYQLLKNDFPKLPAIKIHLHKAIPTGAGLGGGSSDAAFLLKLLNEKYQLNISTDQLISYAAQLGSDCPFFVINKPCFATGRGEKMEEVPLDLSSYQILLVNPGIHVNTGWAFSQVKPGIPARSLKDIISEPVSAWRAGLKNDFENAVSAAHPEIKVIKDELYAHGAIYAAMSGSGSTVFGIFNKGTALPVQMDERYFIKVAM